MCECNDIQLLVTKDIGLSINICPYENSQKHTLKRTQWLDTVGNIHHIRLQINLRADDKGEICEL